MKLIDHEPGENERPKVPDYGERKWARENYGANASFMDLVRFLAPIVAVAGAMYLWRGY